MDARGARSHRTIGENFSHLFRERQIYVRSDAALRFIVVRPWQLMSSAFVFVLGLAWLSVSTFVFVYKSYEISDAKDRTERVQLIYDGRLAAMQTAVERLNEKLMLDQGAYMGKVDGLRGDLSSLVDRQHRLEVFFQQGWLPLRTLSDEDQPASTPAPKPQSLQRQDQEQFNRRAAAVQRDFRTKEEAETPLREIRKLLSSFETTQLALLDRVIGLGEAKAESLRKIYRKLGLDPKTVVASVTLPADAIGGPLLPVQQGKRPQDALDKRLLTAHQKLVEAEKLRHAITLMPVVLPLEKGYRLTSGFGFRRDPFKDVLAMHTGVDLMTAYGTPVMAAADGTVIRAEMSDVYGRVVDIRHDNGITTRYAHMSAMEVKRGDRVNHLQLIGRVGTSGRSTGPHLHYETRVNGKPIDPYEFLRVARNVLQKKGE